MRMFGFNICVGLRELFLLVNIDEQNQSWSCNLDHLDFARLNTNVKDQDNAMIARLKPRSNM